MVSFSGTDLLNRQVRFLDGYGKTRKGRICEAYEEVGIIRVKSPRGSALFFEEEKNTHWWLDRGV